MSTIQCGLTGNAIHPEDEIVFFRMWQISDRAYTDYEAPFAGLQVSTPVQPCLASDFVAEPSPGARQVAWVALRPSFNVLMERLPFEVPGTPGSDSRDELVGRSVLRLEEILPGKPIGRGAGDLVTFFGRIDDLDDLSDGNDVFLRNANDGLATMREYLHDAMLEAAKNGAPGSALREPIEQMATICRLNRTMAMLGIALNGTVDPDPERAQMRKEALSEVTNLLTNRSADLGKPTP